MTSHAVALNVYRDLILPDHRGAIHPGLAQQTPH